MESVGSSTVNGGRDVVRVKPTTFLYFGGDGVRCKQNSRQGATPPAVFQWHACLNPRVGSGIFSNFTGREHVLRAIEVGVCRSSKYQILFYE